MNRLELDRLVHRADIEGMITNYSPRDWEEEDVWATHTLSWNGEQYQCYYCNGQYNTLKRLNGHITRHHALERTQYFYRCLGPIRGCERELKLLSQFIGHMEHSGTCGLRKDPRLNVLMRIIFN